MSKKYDLTKKQLHFFNENQRKFVEANGEKVLLDHIQSDNMDDLINRQFEFLIDEMFNSDDKEIKIDLSRALMFKGWKGVIEIMVAHMMTMNEMGELDDFNAFKEKILSGKAKF